MSDSTRTALETLSGTSQITEVVQEGGHSFYAAVHAQQLHYLSKGWWSKSISWVPTRSHCSPFSWKWKWCWHPQRGGHCEAYWASLCLSNSWNQIEAKAPEEMQSVLQERSLQGQLLPLCLLSKKSWPMLLSLLWTVPHKIQLLGLKLFCDKKKCSVFLILCYCTDISHIYVLFTTQCFCSETFTDSIFCQQYLHKIVFAASDYL